MAELKVAVVGGGYWGKNLIRTFNNLGALVAVYDTDEKLLESYRENPIYTGVEFEKDYNLGLHRWDINGIVIATPPNTHYEIAKDAIDHGKHVFIEKPMTLDETTSNELVRFAKEKNVVIMVGHIFLYSPEIIKLKEIINSEDFGCVKYAYTQRLNLGKIQECGVIMDLAPHDISILDYLFEDTCEGVKVTGESHVIADVEDVAFITMRYKNGPLAHLHLSWLDPLKVRSTVVVGSKQMAVCDSGNKTLHVYNTSVNRKPADSTYASHLLSYKYGDVVSPYIPNAEPMQAEAEEFINCMKEGRTPLADGNLGLSVVKTVVAMKRALINNGGWEEV